MRASRRVSARRRLRGWAAAGLLLAALATAAPAQEPEPTARPTVSVSAEGVVEAEPDRAVLRFGIVTRAAEAEEARAENEAAAAEAMNAARALGITEEDLRLETLQLFPQEERDPDTGRVRRITYEATRLLTVRVDSLPLVPTLVARVVQQGANRLDGLEYELSRRDSVRDAALQEGVATARQKARPMMRMEMAEARGQAEPDPDAYAPGRVEVRATVSVVWELRSRGTGEGGAPDR